MSFLGKTNSFDFFRPNLPKSGSRVGNSENYFRNKNQHPRYTMCVDFQSKWKTLNFWAQICPKKDLGFKTEKNNVGIRINIVETHCLPIFSQAGQLWLVRPKFAQKWILGSEFQKSKSGFGINTSKIPCVPIFSQNGQFFFLIFWTKFGQIAQLRAIFWFKYCCRELGGGWNELGGGWNSWVEVGGAGWS